MEAVSKRSVLTELGDAWRSEVIPGKGVQELQEFGIQEPAIEGYGLVQYSESRELWYCNL